MAKSGLKHIDVGAELTRTEWESEESHELLHGNSFPGSPVERQLFYRDDEHKWYIYDGSEWVWLGGGGGGGMEEHGNEYHDPGFEEEGVAASLLAAHQAIDVHTQPQVPQSHGNDSHSSSFITAAQVPANETDPSMDATLKGVTLTQVRDHSPKEHGNDAHNPDFAEATHTHSDLSPAHKDQTTGVHGVGSSYIALAPAASHLVRTFTKGWTSGKVLKGAGVNADPTEHDYFVPSLRCKVYRATTAQSIVQNSDVKIQYNAEVYDYYNEFDSSTNYRFTASEPGAYLIEGNLQLELSVDGCEYGFKIFKNGTEEASRVATLGKACWGMLGVACVVLLSTNDYIEMKTRHDASSSKNLTADLSRNYICVVRIAPLP